MNILKATSWAIIVTALLTLTACNTKTGKSSGGDASAGQQASQSGTAATPAESPQK
jgi:hypothetical protein